MPEVQTKLLFEIAGVPFELTSNSEAILAEIEPAWTKFQGTQAPQLFVRLIDCPKKMLSVAENPQFLNWEKGRFHLSVGGIEVKWDSSTRQATLIRPQGWGWGDILRMFFGLVLVQMGGVLLHAAAIESRQKVFIFSGPSESGKTTLGRLRGKRGLLTDESVALLPADGKTFAHSTPFFGELFNETQKLRLPVTDIFYIFHGKENRSSRLSDAQALKHFFRNTFHFSWSQPFCEHLLGNCAQMVGAFRSHSLYFLPDESVWDYLREVGHDL